MRLRQNEGFLIKKRVSAKILCTKTDCPVSRSLGVGLILKNPLDTFKTSLKNDDNAPQALISAQNKDEFPGRPHRTFNVGLLDLFFISFINIFKIAKWARNSWVVLA